MQTDANKTRALLTEHYLKYPKLEIRDIFKYLYQSSFGCEHLVSSEEDAVLYIEKEYAEAKKTDAPSEDKLDGEYSRVHLSHLNGGLSPKTLAKIFCLSSQNEKEGREELLKKLHVARELVKEGGLPFTLEDFDRELGVWRDSGYGAVHHSEAFRFCYSPSYRVVANKYIWLLPVLSLIDRGLCYSSLIIAVDGGSASGKTTLAGVLEKIYGCAVFHMDDFFLRPEMRTGERLAEVGGNVDRERFFEEVLKPLSENREVTFSAFDCSSQKLSSPIMVAPNRLTVIEGAYSMHPMLAPYYDFSVFLDIGSEYQRERILKRNSQMLAQRFFDEWIPLEQKYFSVMKIKEKCTVCISVEKTD